MKWMTKKTKKSLFTYTTVFLLFYVNLFLVDKNQDVQEKYQYVQIAEDSLKNVTVKKEEEISYGLQLKRRCNIPDSLPWGHYKIFLYEKGVKAELARLDKSIKEHRKLLKEKLK